MSTAQLIQLHANEWMATLRKPKYSSVFQQAGFQGLHYVMKFWFFLYSAFGSTLSHSIYPLTNVLLNQADLVESYAPKSIVEVALCQAHEYPHCSHEYLSYNVQDILMEREPM